MTDRRLVPVGVDIAPPLSMWTLIGGATYDPVTQELTLPVVGARAVTPNLRVDSGVATLNVGVYVPTGGDGRRLTTWAYGGPTGAATPGDNQGGQVTVTPLDTWHRVVTGMPGTGTGTYIRVGLGVSSLFGTPGTRYRAPVITLSRS